MLFTVRASWALPWEIARCGAAIGGAALYAFYFLLRMIRPGGMGGGDVKLAGVLGLSRLARLGCPLVGAFAAFILGGVVGIALLLARRRRRKAIPFGPWMIAGAWIGIVAGEDIAHWYLGLRGAPEPPATKGEQDGETRSSDWRSPKRASAPQR